jgi:hypothetical protein
MSAVVYDQQRVWLSMILVYELGNATIHRGLGMFGFFDAKVHDFIFIVLKDCTEFLNLD